MKFFGVLAFAAAANAQYFSGGWVPGQAVTAEPAAPSRAGAPSGQRAQAAEAFSFSSLLDVNKILTYGPIKGLFEKAGINITERLEAAAVSPWDDRIPLITDDNYHDMVVNEAMTEEEERDRVWVIVVSASSSRQEGISKFVDGVFDGAYNDTLIANDLPNVRFARIDYLNVTYVTTRWSLWVAPAIVILKDRGQTLRFYRPNQLRIANGALREFLKHDGWAVTPPWTGAFAPGGSREFLLEWFSVWMAKIYLVTIKVPRWLMLLVSGSIASFAINLFHGWGGKKAAPPPKTAARPPVAAAAPAAAPPPAAVATAPVSPSKAKQRKGKGKK
ncbi:hypothetical protein B0H17DRAFT_1329430 [Mycena rosella]|uniref:Thioredoxin-like fold domain-containing protein n=1 Tax=Mycena rosella TaxID=1033263 RepID=A0AAD7DNN6_MYCRO|nr:hypothetical protein B0H17DRAFT_1329430 [Mycena rosella]